MSKRKSPMEPLMSAVEKTAFLNHRFIFCPWDLGSNMRNGEVNQWQEQGLQERNKEKNTPAHQEGLTLLQLALGDYQNGQSDDN